jgi:hypothetical protein
MNYRKNGAESCQTAFHLAKSLAGSLGFVFSSATKTQRRESYHFNANPDLPEYRPWHALFSNDGFGE